MLIRNWHIYVRTSTHAYYMYCLDEKLEIAWADKTRSLNKRSELVSKCRHENKFYLCNFARKVK